MTVPRDEIERLLDSIDKAIMQSGQLGLTTVTYILEIARLAIRRSR
jgi:hypothetical protein